MANPQHVEIVRKGAEALAEWRRTNNSHGLDLRNGTFEYLNLQGADLSHADFSHAIIVGSDLRDANLSNANFNLAYVRDSQCDRAVFLGTGFAFSHLLFCSFREATLKGSQFFVSYCYVVDFSDASLEYATLGATAFVTCNFSRARFDQVMAARATFADVNLNGAIGLNQIHIQAPLTLGIHTVSRSQGLPPELIESAGFTPELMTCLGANMPGYFKFYECIIPFADLEDVFTRKLCADLKERDIRCWNWQTDVRWGQSLLHEIDETIKALDKVVIVFSATTLRNDRFRTELAWALEHDTKTKGHPVLIPMVIDNAPFDVDDELIVQALKKPFIDFRNWTDPHIYAAGLEALTGRLRRPDQ